MPDCCMYFLLDDVTHRFCQVLVSDRYQLDACPMLSSSAPAPYCRPPAVD